MPDTERNGLERAIEIAVGAYAGQTDKAGETYIRHPLRVMEQIDTEPNASLPYSMTCRGFRVYSDRNRSGV